MADKIKKHKNQKILSEENMIEQEGLEKRLDPAAAALAGWWLGGEIAELRRAQSAIRTNAPTRVGGSGSAMGIRAA